MKFLASLLMTSLFAANISYADFSESPFSKHTTLASGRILISACSDPNSCEVIGDPNGYSQEVLDQRVQQLKLEAGNDLDVPISTGVAGGVALVATTVVLCTVSIPAASLFALAYMALPGSLLAGGAVGAGVGELLKHSDGSHFREEQEGEKALSNYEVHVPVGKYDELKKSLAYALNGISENE